MHKKKCKILAVDDTEFFRVLMKRTLEDEGYQVMLACDGNKAFELIKSFQPTLLITDIIMPENDGFELISKLKTSNTTIKIIAISGGGKLSSDFYINSIKKLGVHATLHKPFSPNELLEIVNTVLAS